jgi:DNA repair exonuclease SbcCD nuclease subunit
VKVCVISDTHWSARKSSKLFQDYFELFYKNVFFPYLEENKIDTVIHLGDAFDSRKSIDFSGLDWTQRVVLNPLAKYNVHLLTGNHDCHYRSTNKINSPSLLLQQYPNITVYSEVSEVKIHNLPIAFVPWINPENEQQTFDVLKHTRSKVCMGHLELNGFVAHKGHVMENSRDPKPFHKFDKVFSGHFHSRSDNGKIYYLGNPYEIYFNDVDEDRGFVVFDTETLEHEYVNNPYKLHHQIYYEDDDYRQLIPDQYENKIVKVIVKKKTNVRKFEKYIDILNRANVAELKIIEANDIPGISEFDSLEVEDTFSILNRFVDDSEIELDKSKVKSILSELYRVAMENV